MAFGFFNLKRFECQKLAPPSPPLPPKIDLIDDSDVVSPLVKLAYAGKVLDRVMYVFKIYTSLYT